jgi:hypothetical protein
MQDDHRHKGEHAVQRSFHEATLQEVNVGSDRGIVTGGCNKGVSFGRCHSVAQHPTLEETIAPLLDQPFCALRSMNGIATGGRGPVLFLIHRTQ